MATSPCYVTGTRIATARGEVAVEYLAVGDCAVTAAGRVRPICWIGHRRIACRTYGHLQEVMPVRVAEGAFGPGRPGRDLMLSPGHCVCVDVLGEVLIPIIALVNSATIEQIEVEHVTYWHVELDSHDILLAEGMPAESYLDMGNHGFFSQGSPAPSVVGIQASPDAGPAARTYADYCRPYRASGALIAVLRERLREQALALGWRLKPDSWTGTHLLVDGARVDPEVEGLRGRFAMPAGARDVWLVSDTSVPSHVGESSDERMLGVSVEGLHVDDGVETARSVDLTDPLLCVGFHHIEDGPRRWTAGRARLPRALWARCRGAWSLRLDLTASALPRWRAPGGTISGPTRSQQGAGCVEQHIA